MTDVADLCRAFEHAKATNTPITISSDDLAAMFRLRSLMGDGGSSEPALAVPTIAADSIDEIHLISIEEVAKELKCSLKTLWRLRRADKSFPIPVRATARRKMFVRAEFNDWLMKRR